MESTEKTATETKIEAEINAQEKIIKELPKMISSTQMQLMILPLTVKYISKDLREKDLETYFGLKAKLRDFLASVETCVEETKGVLVEMA